MNQVTDHDNAVKKKKERTYSLGKHTSKNNYTHQKTHKKPLHTEKPQTTKKVQFQIINFYREHL